MFLTFFTELRRARVPVTPREYLDLVRALELDVADHSIEDFYRLARATLVKDERHLDKFDVVFASVFKGILSAERGRRGGRVARGMAAQARREVF